MKMFINTEAISLGGFSQNQIDKIEKELKKLGLDGKFRINYFDISSELIGDKKVIGKVKKILKDQ